MTLQSKRGAPAAPRADDRPTVLFVGTGEPMQEALTIALDRHSIAVEKCEAHLAVESVFVGAPDVVLLVGDAAEDQGSAILAKLAANVATAVVPVALLADDQGGLDERLRAFRYGAVAVVERSASVDAMARRIAELARELPERKGETGGEIGEASLDEVVELFSRRLRTGILAVTAPGVGPDAAARIVLRGDRPVTQAIEEFVDRIRPLVSEAAPLHFEFQEAPAGRVHELALDDVSPDEAGAAALFTDRRIVLVERSPARADELVQVLRDRGAHVVVIDGEGTGLHRARAIDPDVIVVDVAGIGGWASSAMRSIRRDPRLRWASWLVAKESEIWPPGAPMPDLERLAAGLSPLVEPDAALLARARGAKEAFEARLESTGPARMLRALCRAQRTVHLTVRHARALVEVDLAEGLVVGASARIEDGTKIEGAGALAALVALSTGRVRVEPREAPSMANVMSPVDDALAAADREPPPLRPSAPPPSLPPPPSGEGSRGSKPALRPSDPSDLVRQLESLLGRLRKSLPDERASDAPQPASAEPVQPAADAAAGAKAALIAAVAGPRSAPGKLPPPSRLPTPTGRVTPREAPKPPDAPHVSAVAVAPIVAVHDRPPPAPSVAVVAGIAVTSPVATATLPTEASVPSETPATPSGKRVRPPMPAPPVQALEAIAIAEAPVQSASSPGTHAAIDPTEELSPSPTYVPTRVATRKPQTSPLGAMVAGAAAAVLLVGAGAGGAIWWRWSSRRSAQQAAEEAAATFAVPPAVAAAPPSAAPQPAAPSIANAAAEPIAPAPAEAIAPAPAEAIAPAPTEAIAPAPAEAVAPAPAIAIAPELVADADDDDAAVDPADDAHTSELRTLIRRANFNRTHGNLQSAEADYLRVLRAERHNPRAMVGLARLHVARRDTRSALVWARRLVESRPTQPGNQILLGDVLALSGDQAGARRAWQRALQLSPTNEDARRRLR